MERTLDNDKIKGVVIEVGTKLFSQKGFKATSVSEITERVGIGTGTFYNYFSSKEELFLVVFIAENNKLKKEIMEKVDLQREPVDVVKDLLYLFFEGMHKNIILREFFGQNTFRKIEQKTDFKKEQYGEVAYELFIPLIQTWQSKGIIKKKDPKYLIAFFDAMLYVFLHKSDIGINFFPNLMDDLITFIIQGLKDDGRGA